MRDSIMSITLVSTSLYFSHSIIPLRLVNTRSSLLL